MEIRKTLPDQTGVNLSLEHCQFSINSTKNNETSEQLALSRLEADLTSFKFDSVGIRTVSDGRAILTIKAKPVSDRQLDQAEALVALVPEEMRSKRGSTLTMIPNDGPVTITKPLAADESGVLERSTLKDLLEQPNGRLSFHLSSVVRITEEVEAPAPPQPHKDAPGFHKFAQEIQADDRLNNYSLSLVYVGAEPDPDSLFVAGLSFPPQLQFITPSVDKAKELARTIMHYGQTNCR
ncbi:hypothetical protein [Leisingera sp. M658]|uniref:hypothetical protein n=1 Tax=Leisingera sp. M658 TaxID=2867015 RepID=UPI0021A8B004|nr:hypothetical protein [Leisingera sp. M658]UWQ77297.1 hypothetical protein K3724_21940 [Leisingera sp. M658]